MRQDGLYEIDVIYYLVHLIERVIIINFTEMLNESLFSVSEFYRLAPEPVYIVVMMIFYYLNVYAEGILNLS